MVKFIESELVSLKKEVNEMWTLVYNNAAAPAVLTKYLETHPDNFLTCLELGTVIRKLERAGDHITNIAEEIVFFIDAKVLKHRDKVDGHFLGKEKTH